MTKRRKPLRQHARRRWPTGRAMARMELLNAWGELHPTKGYRPKTKFERFVMGMN